MIDRRLIGTWRSDRKKTFSDWVWPGKRSTKSKERFKALFGHLEIRYTARWCSVELKGSKSKWPYHVLAINYNSVVIAKLDTATNEEQFSILTFEGDWYWIPLGQNREWFRKIA